MDSLVCFSSIGPAGIDDAAVDSRAAATGLPAHDVRRRLRSGRLCVLKRDSDRETLEKAAHALVELGDAAAVLADDELRAAPPPRLARAVRLSGGRLEFLGAEAIQHELQAAGLMKRQQRPLYVAAAGIIAVASNAIPVAPFVLDWDSLYIESSWYLTCADEDG